MYVDGLARTLKSMERAIDFYDGKLGLRVERIAPIKLSGGEIP
jgi:catechol 2,3-dioxygenase-like lactoylglutathione lyase family enzyme